MTTFSTRGNLCVHYTQAEKKAIKAGWLECSLGRFRVQYEHLESMQEGNYDGFFEIAKIQPGSYCEKGRHYFEVEAILTQIASISSPKLPQTQQEIPLEEKAQTTESISKTDKDADLPIAITSTKIDNNPDVELFGALWPLADTVQLDMTQNRNLIRKQNNRLDKLGYRFDEKRQCWQKAA